MQLDPKLQKGFNLIVFVFGLHALLGLYAVYFNGNFIMGATMPERYLVQWVNGGEITFNPTGSSAYHANDLCLQDCDDCNSFCYPYSRLEVDCGSCLIKTSSGKVVVQGGDYFRAVANRLFVIENTTFKCYHSNATECGFVELLENNYTVLHKI